MGGKTRNKSDTMKMYRDLKKKKKKKVFRWFLEIFANIKPSGHVSYWMKQKRWVFKHSTSAGCALFQISLMLLAFQNLSKNIHIISVYLCIYIH